jgi:hypothetical protein
MLSRRLIASFSLLAFFVTMITGLVYQVRPDVVMIRSFIAFMVFGGATFLCALIFERLWSR